MQCFQILLLIRTHQFRGRRWRRCPQVGDKIGDGEIDLMAVDPWTISILKAITPKEAARRVYPESDVENASTEADTSAGESSSLVA